MISNGAFRSLKSVMWYVTFLRIVPFTWDDEKCKLKKMAKWYDQVINRINEGVTYSLAIFAILRFVQTFSVQNLSGRALPLRVITMNILWGFAYTFSAICTYQQSRNRESIQVFANAMFAYIRKTKGNERRKDAQKKIDFISIIIILSGIMVVINPPFHSIMMIDTPCAPHFSSSIWLTCSHLEEDSHPFVDKIFFIITETYFALLIFLPLTFNWTFIYIGLGWISEEQRDLRNKLSCVSITDDWLVEKYRRLCLLCGILNDNFRLYLQWFPTLLLGIVSFLMYACIKFPSVGWRAYVMFPSCLIRCSFEAFTPLGLAGQVNQNSFKFLREWKQRGQGIEAEQFHRAIQRSCPLIQCTAGGMFTFENSIVFISLSNCIILTVNLLLL